MPLIRKAAAILLGGILLCLLPSSVRADTWKDGDLTTYRQVDWATNPGAIALLADNLASVYATVGSTLVVGLPTNFVLVFSGPAAVASYLPSAGAAGPLNASLSDPLMTSSGVYGGDVVALKLDVDFKHNANAGKSKHCLRS